MTLRLGRSSKVDVLLVHLREAEMKFMQEGHGATRHEVMKNEFFIVGPKNEPAIAEYLKDLLTMNDYQYEIFTDSKADLPVSVFLDKPARAEQLLAALAELSAKQEVK